MEHTHVTNAETIDIASVDLDGDAFASRLANLLAHHRRESGERLNAVAKRSQGRFTARQLKAYESGHGTPVDAAEVAALYGADLTAILPARLPIEIDDAGVIRTAGVSEEFGSGDETALLMAYLRLVRRLRDQQRAEVVDLRRDDVEVLAATLDLPGETIVDRLGLLMGATRVERRIMAGMFIAGAAIIGLTVTTVAATSGGSSDAPDPTPPPIDPSSLTTLVDDLPIEPPPPRPTGTPIPVIPFHESTGFLEANGMFITMPGTTVAPPATAPEPTTPAPTTPADVDDVDDAPPATEPPAAAPPPAPAPPPAATPPPATPAPTTTEPDDVATGPPPVPVTEPPIVEPEPTPPPTTAAPTTAPPTTEAPTTTTEPEVATGPPPVPSDDPPIP